MFNLILGAIAGYVARFVEQPLSKLLTGRYAMETENLRVLSFIILLLGASVLIGLGGVDGKPFLLLIGGGIGIFFDYLLKLGREEYAIQKAKMDERKEGAGGSTDVVEPRVKPAAAKKPAAKKAPAKKPTAKKPT